MRGLPEGDNPLFNKLYAIGLARRLQNQNVENLILGGMHFGGLELPWVVAQEMKQINIQQPELLTIHFSPNRHLG